MEARTDPQQDLFGIDGAGISRGIEALIRRYEMEQGDDVWLCTYKLKEIGCDLEKWEKERGDQ